MIPKTQRTKLTFDSDCVVCEWMQEWSERENADFGMLMEPYIPHRLQHSIDYANKLKNEELNEGYP